MINDQKTQEAFLKIRSRVIVAFSSLGLFSGFSIDGSIEAAINGEFHEEVAKRIKQINAMSMVSLNMYDWESVLSDHKWITILQNAHSYKGLSNDFCSSEFKVLHDVFGEERIDEIVRGKRVSEIVDELEKSN